VLDLGTLALGLNSDNPQRGNVGMAVAAVAGVTALDLVCAQRLSADGAQSSAPIPDYGDRRGLPRPPEAMRGSRARLSGRATCGCPKRYAPIKAPDPPGPHGRGKWRTASRGICTAAIAGSQD
jgi:hypothetical protein